MWQPNYPDSGWTRRYSVFLIPSDRRDSNILCFTRREFEPTAFGSWDTRSFTKSMAVPRHLVCSSLLFVRQICIYACRLSRSVSICWCGYKTVLCSTMSQEGVRWPSGLKRTLTVHIASHLLGSESIDSSEIKSVSLVVFARFFKSPLPLKGVKCHQVRCHQVQI